METVHRLGRGGVNHWHLATPNQRLPASPQTTLLPADVTSYSSTPRSTAERRVTSRVSVKDTPTGSRESARLRSALRPHSVSMPRNIIRSAGRVALGAKAWRSSVIKKYYDEAGEQMEKPLQRFRRVARSVSIISAICVVIKRYAQKGTQMEWQTIQTNLKLFAEFDSMVAFNFANSTHSTSIKAKAGERIQRIMSQTPDERLEKDIQAIKWLLRENDTFQGYPVTTQTELARCAQYMRYEARRIIVRQGHQAEAFYIVLNGTVLSSLRREGAPPRLIEISAGGAFGDQSLLLDSRRTYTVVCKTDVELVTIMKEDFDRIIKGPQLQQKERHLEYLRSLPLFEQFPVENLSEGSNGFYHKYFKKGREVASTKTENELLVIIQSGYCKVVADVGARGPAPRPSTNATTRAKMAALFPDMQHIIQARNLRSKSADELHWQTGEIRETMKANILTGNTSPDRILKTTNHKTTDEQEYKPPYSLPDRFQNFDKENLARVAELRRGIGRSLRRLSTAAKSVTTKRTQHTQQTVVQPSMGRAEVKEPGVTTAQLATLGTGDVFGLEGLFQGYPINLRLVSEGAECILLSKKAFLKDCNTQVLQRVSDLIISYPSSEYVRAKLSEERKWQSYKQRVLNDVIHSKLAWPR